MRRLEKYDLRKEAQTNQHTKAQYHFFVYTLCSCQDIFSFSGSEWILHLNYFLLVVSLIDSTYILLFERENQEGISSGLN